MIIALYPLYPAWNAATNGITYDQIGAVMLGLINSFSV